MFDTLSVHVKDLFMRGRTGDELPNGMLPSMESDSCVRSSSIPSNCMECSYGAGGHADADKICCGHPDKPENTFSVMTKQFATKMRQPWCPLVVGRLDV